MKDSATYSKIVEWSEVDQVYIGTVPGLFYGCYHGDDEQAVFAELCEIVEENIAIYHERGIPLTPPTIACDCAVSFKTQSRAGPLPQAGVQALQTGHHWRQA
jgi:predicted RNase H-like HicB family nuclease